MRRTTLPRDDGGQILMMALAFIVFVGLTAFALVSFATTTTASSNNLRQLRSARTAADHAVAALIQSVRNQATQGVPGTCTPTQNATEDNIAVTATCSGQTTDAPGHRYVYFTAKWGSLTVLKAVVTFQDYKITSSGLVSSTGAGEQVNEWTYGQ